MKKKYIKEDRERNISDITGNIQEVIDYLEGMKKARWETIEYDSGGEQIIFTRHRLETDTELAKRKEDLQKQKIENAKQKAHIEERDRLLYEKLKKKYETDIN